MNKLNFSIDVKSLVIGVLFSAVIFLSFAHTKVPNENSQYRYETSTAGDTYRSVVITDTYTGEFIYCHINKWVKRDFNSIPLEKIENISPSKGK